MIKQKYQLILAFDHKRTSGSKSLQSVGIVHIGVWENKNVYDEIIPEEMGFSPYALADRWNSSKTMIKKIRQKWSLDLIPPHQMCTPVYLIVYTPHVNVCMLDMSIQRSLECNLKDNNS